MYGLWAQKPLNVQDPTLVTFEEDPESLAFMLETLQSYFAKRYHGFSYPNSETGTFKGEFIMVLLNKVEPKCVYFNHFYEGLPQMITEAVIQDKGHHLVQISTYYGLSSTDQNGIDHHHPMSRPVFVYDLTSNDPVICTIYSGQVLSFPDQILSCKIGLKLPMFTKTTFYPDRKFIYRDKFAKDGVVSVASLTRKDLKRLPLVSAWISKLETRMEYRALLGDKALYDEDSRETSLEKICFSITSCPPHSEPLLSIPLKNWTGLGISEARDRAWFTSALALLPTAYGCVHVETLGFTFPTPIERLLWKISCIILIAGGGATGVLFFLLHVDTLINRAWTKYRQTVHVRSNPDIEVAGRSPRRYDSPLQALRKVLGKAYSWTFEFIFWSNWRGHWWILEEDVEFFGTLLLYCAILLLYCAARVYVVLESFISLRHEPIGVYQTPSGNFMNYIPHL